MSSKIPSVPRLQTNAEEFANSLSHGLGLVAAVVGTPFLIMRALSLGERPFLVGVSIFSATMIILYFCSALYHLMPHGKAKRVCKVIDHSAIYLLIAGTYTPFTLGALSGAWGWALFCVVWVLAAMGVLLKALSLLDHPFWSTGLYLLMGYLVLVALKPLSEAMPSEGMFWLAGGGAAYTLGVVFYILDTRLHFAHFVWHLFVLAGTALHYFAILWYAN